MGCATHFSVAGSMCGHFKLIFQLNCTTGGVSLVLGFNSLHVVSMDHARYGQTFLTLQCCFSKQLPLCVHAPCFWGCSSDWDCFSYRIDTLGIDPFTLTWGSLLRSSWVLASTWGFLVWHWFWAFCSCHLWCRYVVRGCSEWWRE